MASVGVLGAGTWGIALARMLSKTGHDVTVWSAIAEEIDGLAATGKHPKLPHMVLPAQMRYTKELKEVCTGKDIVLFAVPSVFVRSTARAAKEFIPQGQIVTDVAKGIESDTFMTMTQILADELGPGVRLVALSGPTHAEEVAVDLATTIVAASPDREAAEFVQNVFSNENMRVYTNEDMHGVEICGALKNVMALAAGISSGLGQGDNAKAAIITRGLSEMVRLGSAMGCSRETFFGLAGLGDLVVTCTSEHSRNNRCGQLIGQGLTAEQAVKEVGMVVEGLNALPAAVALSKKYGVEMPIVEYVDALVKGKIESRDAVRLIMNRKKKDETD